MVWQGYQCPRYNGRGVNKRKVKSSKVYVCSHCGFEIATIYDTGSGQVLESRAGKALPGVAVKIFDTKSGRALVVCPSCGKETPVIWDLKLSAKTRMK